VTDDAGSPSNPPPPTAGAPDDLAAALLARCEGDLAGALEVLGAARDAVAAAQQRHESARQAVHKAMRRLGHAHQAAEQPMPRQTMRSLYWDHPDVRADEIAKAFEVRGGAGLLAPLVGPDEREVACAGGCGRTMVRRKRNRTDAKMLTCEYCQREAQQAAAERRAWLEQHEADWNAAYDRWASQVEALAAEGVFSGRVLVEHPDIPGVWRLDRHGRAERVD